MGHLTRRVCGVCLFVILVVGASATQPSQGSLRVLVTNDDGVRTLGIQTLATALRRVADEVVVVAPDGNRSGSSHASSTGTPVIVQEMRDGNRVLGYGINGFPADAVRFGILELGGERGFDLVVSGINRGANVGTVAHLSGTVGAAMEALYLGVPAVAVSQDSGSTDYALAASLTVDLVGRLRSESLPVGVVLSINVPSDDPDEVRGVVAAPMGGSYLDMTGYDRVDASTGVAGTYVLNRGGRDDFAAGTDSRAYDNGFITITPLRFDWTDHPAVGLVNRLGLTVPGR